MIIRELIDYEIVDIEEDILQMFRGRKKNKKTPKKQAGGRLVYPYIFTVMLHTLITTVSNISVSYICAVYFQNQDATPG